VKRTLNILKQVAFAKYFGKVMQINLSSHLPVLFVNQHFLKESLINSSARLSVRFVNGCVNVS